MKIDLNKPFLGLDGKQIESEGKKFTVGQRLAIALSNDTESDGLKYYIWATDLYKGKSFDIDEVDGEALKKFVSTCRMLTAIEKGQITKLLTGNKSD